jgi:hypothetical protein
MGVQYPWAVAGLALAMFLSTGCKKSEGATCFELTDCEDGLACLGDNLRRCEKCDASEACSVSGLCTVKEGACVAASNDDCKKGYICGGKGACTAEGGKCTVGGEADCKQSDACKNEGYCIAKGNNCIREKKKAEPKPKKPDEDKAGEEKKE